ncbi:MAG: OmpA family protein, partial [Bryobacteraceae bacterium]|jgi:Outer membrane protein and related peptidoglycan-associated (lipo)proteins|nr:OmpA family protein [Bryobacteraceae bacterium]
MTHRRITTGAWIAAAAAIPLLAGMFAASKRILDRLNALEQQMAALGVRMEETARDSRAAAEQASQALARADEAAQGRVRAEEAKTEAEARAQKAQELAQSAQAETERLRRERQEELNRMQEALNRLVETRKTALGLVMSLPERALRFEFDSARLGPESRELLSRIAGVLLASDGYGLTVHGHTDDVGTDEYNQQLSERRADAVRQYLIQAGIDPQIISIRGHGKSSPIAKGRTEADRAKNRRVEIALTDTKIEYAPTVPKR